MDELEYYTRESDRLHRELSLWLCILCIRTSGIEQEAGTRKSRTMGILRAAAQTHPPAVDQERRILGVLVPFGGAPGGELLLESLNHGDQVLGFRGQLVRGPAVVLELAHGAGVFPLKPEAEGTLTRVGFTLSSP